MFSQLPSENCEGRLRPGRRRVKGQVGGAGAPSKVPPGRHAFTLLELLIVISIIALLISILLPALSRAREISNRTVCGSNMRQLGVAFLNYAQDFNGWFPVKPKFNDPNPRIQDLATVQHGATPDWGPNFAGMIRDIVERRHTREDADFPLYLPAPKIMLCPSDKVNNRPQTNAPGQGAPEGPLWPTAEVRDFRDLPRSGSEEANLAKSFISYFYVALWRNDDRGDFIMAADQSNNNDTTINSFTGLTPEDNHGTRGMNILLTDSHVEWSSARSGSFQDMQAVSNRYWGPIVATRARYPDTDDGANRSVEVQTIE